MEPMMEARDANNSSESQQEALQQNTNPTEDRANNDPAQEETAEVAEEVAMEIEKTEEPEKKSSDHSETRCEAPNPGSEVAVPTCFPDDPSIMAQLQIIVAESTTEHAVKQVEEQTTEKTASETTEAMLNENSCQAKDTTKQPVEQVEEETVPMEIEQQHDISAVPQQPAKPASTIAEATEQDADHTQDDTSASQPVEEKGQDGSSSRTEEEKEVEQKQPQPPQARVRPATFFSTSTYHGKTIRLPPPERMGKTNQPRTLTLERLLKFFNPESYRGSGNVKLPDIPKTYRRITSYLTADELNRFFNPETYKAKQLSEELQEELQEPYEGQGRGSLPDDSSQHSHDDLKAALEAEMDKMELEEDAGISPDNVEGWLSLPPAERSNEEIESLVTSVMAHEKFQNFLKAQIESGAFDRSYTFGTCDPRSDLDEWFEFLQGCNDADAKANAQAKAQEEGAHGCYRV